MNERKRLGNWYLSSIGKKLWPFDVRPDDIDIEWVAHALSNLCRFGGHCKQFYSVAQHSVHVSELCKREPIWGLLHDASEAILCDVPRPIKQADCMDGYREAEHRALEAVAQRYNLAWPMPNEVHDADDVMLHTEAYFLSPGSEVWVDYGKVVSGWGSRTLRPWLPAEAKQNFLDRWAVLVGARGR